MEVLHVCQPFKQQVSRDPVHIANEMVGVIWRKFLEIIPAAQFFGQMENRPEQLGKGIVFQQVWIPEEQQQELSFPGEEFMEFDKSCLGMFFGEAAR